MKVEDMYKMNATGICPYKTPCGWCFKWDKKCDKKIPSKRGKRSKLEVYGDYDGWEWTCDISRFLTKTH